MLGRIAKLFSGQGPAPRRHVAPKPTVDTVLTPDAPFCAIGDAHGCLNLLQPLYDKLRAELGPDIPVVFLGDMVDRGPDAAGVLSFVHRMVTDQPDSHIAIMGNHEQMMLEFIDDPAGKGLRWLTFGGVETLASFGIQAASKNPDLEDAMEWSEALEKAMPDGLLDWIRQLPARWSSGNIHCVHAGMHPDDPIDQQKSRTMINGHPLFLNIPRDDGQTVLHGHTVMADATIGDTRISIDTGAYFTGTLTAAYIAEGTCRFIT
jgi:serine/threonine protein phosphatase 1